MRIRSVKPDFWRDELVGQMSGDLALFFIGMSCVADDDGRFAWNPTLIRSDLDPYDARWSAEQVVAMLERLQQLGRLQKYSVNGKAYGWMPSFKRHQKVKKPTESRLPPPPVPHQFPTSGGGVPVGDGDGDGDGVGCVDAGDGGSATSESTGTSRGQVLPLPAKGVR